MIVELALAATQYALPHLSAREAQGVATIASEGQSPFKPAVALECWRPAAAVWEGRTNVRDCLMSSSTPYHVVVLRVKELKDGSGYYVWRRGFADRVDIR